MNHLAREIRITVEVTRAMSDGQKKTDKNDEIGIPLPPQEEPLATVGVKAGATVNL